MQSNRKPQYPLFDRVLNFVMVVILIAAVVFLINILNQRYQFVTFPLGKEQHAEFECDQAPTLSAFEGFANEKLDWTPVYQDQDQWWFPHLSKVVAPKLVKYVWEDYYASISWSRLGECSWAYVVWPKPNHPTDTNHLIVFMKTEHQLSTNTSSNVHVESAWQPRRDSQKWGPVEVFGSNTTGGTVKYVFSESGVGAEALP